MSEKLDTIIAQNERILANQETIIEMLRIAPYIVFGATDRIIYGAFLEPYYKHHNKPLSELHQLLEEMEEPLQKQPDEREFRTIGSQDEECS